MAPVGDGLAFSDLGGVMAETMPVPTLADIWEAAESSVPGLPPLPPGTGSQRADCIARNAALFLASLHVVDCHDLAWPLFSVAIPTEGGFGAVLSSGIAHWASDRELCMVELLGADNA